MAADETLWSETIRREQLVELLDGRREMRLREADLLSLCNADPGNGLLAVWSGRQRSKLSPLPQIIVARSRSSLRDLYAWSASYVRGLGPLSGVARTMSMEQLRTVADRRRDREFWSLAPGAVGLVLCETIAQNGRGDFEGALNARPNITLSFALIRAWTLGYPPDAIAEIIGAYLSLPRDHEKEFDQDLARAAAEVVFSLFDIDASPGLLLNSTKNWMAQLRVGRRVAGLLPDVLAPFVDAHDVLGNFEQLTPEQRVKFFDFVAPRIVAADEAHPRSENAFALAFAAFALRPGLEQQASLMSEYAVKLSAAWLWLGALQTFSRASDMLTIGQGSGWRIAREIVRDEDLWGVPQCDLSIVELDVLLSAKTQIGGSLMRRQRVEVEIYPLITSAIRGTTSERGASEGPERNFARSLDLIGGRLNEALAMLKLLREGGGDREGSGPRRRRPPPR
ncbi:hypothetical protein ABIA06_005044 [Bradyrhizobium yuanmingense]|uniref:hypothetical protein n=1 Tax=Bradyrhizobium yuanmingense TaxID=108015 RepID=UPI00351896F3